MQAPSQSQDAQVIAEYLKANYSPEQIEALVVSRSIRTNPAAYAKYCLGLQWTPDQQKISRSVIENEKTVVRSAHGIGKTHSAAGMVQWYFDTYPDSIVLTTAPVWSSVRDLLWAEISSQRHRAMQAGTLPAGALGSSFTHFDLGIPLMLRTNELHYAHGYNSRTAEGFQGRHGARIFIVLDEGAGVPDHIWKAAHSMLQSEDCRILVIGNPTTTSGPFYDACYDPSWNCITVSALNHPNIHAELQGLPPIYPAAVRLSWVNSFIESDTTATSDPAEIDANCIEWPPHSGIWRHVSDEFRIRVLGMPPLTASAAIWSEAWIDEARIRDLHVGLQLPPLSPLQIGVDAARYGQDRTVMMARWGDRILGDTVKSFSKINTVEITGAVINIVNQLAERFEIYPYEIPIAVDDDGVGGGVTDLLQNQGYMAIPVLAATVAMKPLKYPNRRAEMWFEAADLARRAQLDLTELSIDDFKALRADLLSTFIWKYDLKGRRVVEPKDRTRKRIGRSPDYADAFLLCLTAPHGGWSHYNGAFKGTSDEYDALSESKGDF